ncbi:MAG: peptidase M23 [Bacteroidetes bacterium OLB11]|nr:MAG: peptidase M23 [Bacteroidetes bacterium OLB11]
MKKYIHYIIICLTLFALPSYAQKKQTLSKDQLENQRQTLLSEIKETQNQLTELRKDKKASLNELQALQAKLNARQKLISNINSEISIIERNIELTNNDVHTLKNELDTLKKQYAEMVRYSYKNRTSTDMIVFLFSSTSFNDAIRRLNYVKQYRNYRADQSVKILSASQQLNNKINVLSLEKKKKDIVLAAQQNQNSILEQETEEKDKMVNELKGKEKELLASIAKIKRQPMS